LLIQRLRRLLILLAHDAVKEERKAAHFGIPSVTTRGIFSMSAFTSAEINRQSADYQ
jgi:hypothetical protein